MAIDLYSKSATDTLLAAKLSDAPSDGTTYGRKDAAWVAVGGGSNDWLAMSNAGLASALTLHFVSLTSSNVFEFSVGSGFIPANIINGACLGVTQDGTNFYPFDGYTSANIFTVSGFTFDSSNYVFIAFKDSAGTWHYSSNNNVIYSP